jgi:dTDP-4-amino-4,6-dideoxygalactose transaminase
MPAVPFIDLGRVNARYGADIERVALGVLSSGRYLQGEQVAQFERAFADWNGARECVAVANGLDALRLTLRAWITMGRLAPGDEVMVPANSFIASALAATEAGLEVRFADVDPSTFNLSLATLRAAITPATRVVMPVHLYGRLADIEPIAAFCAERDILVLEDAAQAHGAVSAGTRAGCFADAGAFSFYPTKNLGAFGDAGCVLVKDPALGERIRALGNYGSVTRYVHDHLGTNSRMDEVQAAILSVKLKGLARDNAARRAVAEAYLARIRQPAITLPQPGHDPLANVWHIFPVISERRDALVAHLSASGVQALVHYPTAIHRHPPYARMYPELRFRVAERLCAQELSLPISPVMGEEEIDRVVDSINAWRPT